MNVDLNDDAVEFGVQARRAIGAAGGDELVQAAEADPEARQRLVEPVLTELGAWDIDPRTGDVELEAAAALCRSAGYWALPYPVAERLAKPADVDVDGLVMVGGAVPSAPLGHLDLRWAALSLDGRRSHVKVLPSAVPVRKSAFITDLELEPLDEAGADDVALSLVLPCWTLIGMMDRAIELACEYALGRKQFGQPLAAFQGVQFQLTDAEVERAGVEELAKYSLWSTRARPGHEAVADALGLRLAAVEAADIVFRVTHQVHGAIGFCDETVLSWVSRYSQPIRRLPLTTSATRDALVRHLGNQPLAGLFGAGSTR